MIQASSSLMKDHRKLKFGGNISFAMFNTVLKSRSKNIKVFRPHKSMEF